MKPFCFRLLLLCCVITTGLYAQDTGQITGTVRDNTGAVIPGAEVTVTSTAQGVPHKTTSNSAGEYLVAGLPAGTYNIEITAKGFKKFVVTGIVLRVAEKARADCALDVGEVTTEVTVTGEGVAQVETQSSEVSGVVTGRQISQLVLNNRNFVQLVTLVPGVSNRTGQDEPAVGVYGSVAMAINGGRTEYNNWELDGGDNMDNGSNSTLNVYPNADAIAEVKVLTSNYGAQYGRNGSGTVETVTKSGGKDFHGDLFEFVRNDNFNARNFFDTQRPGYKKNDFGYTLGGPLYIPGFYNKNKDKTFFFWSEEWRRERVPAQVFQQAVPSVAERGGDFSDLCTGATLAAPGECPVNPATGQFFPNNTVPVDPNAAAIVNALIPQPNQGSGANSFFNASPVTPTNWREELIRVDHNFSDRLRLFGRFIHDSWSTVVPGALWGNGTSSFPTVKTNFVGPGVAVVAHLTANVSPSLLNEFIFSYTTDHIFLNPIGNLQRPSSMTMTGLFNNGFGGQLPAFTLNETGTAYGGGFGADPGYFPWNNANPTYTYRDQLTKISGNHNMYFGAYFAAAQKNEMNSPNLDGILTFDNTSPYTTGNAFADLLTGRIANYQQWSAKIKYYNRYKILEPYFQDDWHVTRKLTLNLGLRISLFGTYRDRYKTSYNFEPAAFNPSNAPKIDQNGFLIPNSGNFYDGMVQCGANGSPAGCMKGHLFNPAPRFGFAYDPLGNGRTAIRGGYGIFFEHTNGNEGNTESLEGNPPGVITPTQYNIIGFTNIGGSGLLPPFSCSFACAIPTRAIWPYMQQWHLDVQHELVKNTVVQVSYVGSKGTHLTLQQDINQLFALPASLNPFSPGQRITGGICNSMTVNGQPVTGQAAINLGVACGGDPNPSRFYQGWGGIPSLADQANSIYNAMQVSVRRAVGRLQYSLAYTWSHSIDDASDRYEAGFVDSYNLTSARASSNFDQRHILNISYIYDLPFFTQPGLANKVLGGWQLSGITTFQTGVPVTVRNRSHSDNAGVGNTVGAGSYPDVVGDPNSSFTQVGGVEGHPGPLLFNPAAYAAPTGLTFGTGGRNQLKNPARTNFDMGLFKRFAITESRAFEFRAEAFNVFNHTQWSGVNRSDSCYRGSNNSSGDASCVDTSGFLHPSGAHNPRILQLALKFLF
ncbi:MAG TPA: carboxypeptidase regulatory-like domain-containing protein [Candidatus Angelobacter sp.]|nr:carboxypeptidase regulatory-like domain-containing protein [Candidatus Angelobacter sp.]